MSFTGTCTWIADATSPFITELSTTVLFKAFSQRHAWARFSAWNKRKSDVWFNRTKWVICNVDWNQCRCCKESRFPDVWFTNQSNSHGLTASLHSSSVVPERTLAITMSSSGRLTRPSPSRSINSISFAMSQGGRSAISALRSACWSS